MLTVIMTNRTARLPFPRVVLNCVFSRWTRALLCQMSSAQVSMIVCEYVVVWLQPFDGYNSEITWQAMDGHSQMILKDIFIFHRRCTLTFRSDIARTFVWLQSSDRSSYSVSEGDSTSVG